ncbi:hypothetical protein GOP47_0023358 [Adiantum capillus-veneris]|uniref:Pentatricopeptide repeat-containing protein n=1 Tax=Adiantum capillus-veneris TaxID=13818 RepID=A0A9D4U3I6_ADICA|nr:hypothetical protein GOP47_0023358 [Adiantum capillus-veneris]
MDLPILRVISRDGIYNMLQGCIKKKDLSVGRMSHPTLYTWNAIISANSELANPERSFKLYQRMRQLGVEPNKFIFLSILQVCSSTNALEQGRIIHEEIRANGLLSDVFVGNTVIDMYIKCNSLEEAKDVFDKLSRDMVSWSIMITGYVHAGHVAAAIELFLELQREGFMPNEVIFVCMIFESLDSDDVVSWGAIIAGLVHNGESLSAVEFFERLQQKCVHPTNVIFASAIKACSSLRSLQKGRSIHCHILWTRVKSDLVIGNSLVDMYAKCYSTEEALQVFNALSIRDDVSWGAMFSVYAQQGHDLAAFQLFERLQQEGLKANKVVYMSMLSICGSLEAISNGRQVHNQIIVHGLHHDIEVSGTLIDMYVKCGSLDEAQKVFDSSSNQDTISWGALISGYGQHGHFYSAFELLQKLQLHGMKPDSFMFLSILKASDSVIAKEECRILHRQIIYWGYEMEVFLVNPLIQMYGNSGDVECAYKVFDGLSIRDDVSWRVMMAAYLENGQALSGLEHCASMCQSGMKMGRIMLVYVLKALGIVGDMRQGHMVHDQVVRDEFEKDVVVGSTLIDMYANSGYMYDACDIFGKLPTHNTVTYGVMIAGYVQHGAGLAALELYETMRSEKIEPTEATYLCCLKACGLVGALTLGRLLHMEISMIEYQSVAFGSTLLYMYATCESLEDACRVFEDMSVRDVVSWELMISIYAEYGYSQSALESFERMQQEGFKPRGPTFLCALNACADLGVLGYGHVIHDQLMRNESCSDIVLVNAVIDCYARCGSMREAHALFEKLLTRNVVSWCALIQGYSHLGDAISARQCLEAMEKEGMKLNEQLYTNVLAACRHSGLLEEACYHFMRMKDFRRITPTAEHYNCLIDLLCRSGNLDEAESILKGMHLTPDIVAWRSLLACFTTCQDTERSFRCFNEVSRLDPINGSAYALMSNIFTNTPDQTYIPDLSSMRNNICTNSTIINSELTQQYTKRIKSESLSCYQDHISMRKRCLSLFL